RRLLDQLAHALHQLGAGALGGGVVLVDPDHGEVARHGDSSCRAGRALPGLSPLRRTDDGGIDTPPGNSPDFFPAGHHEHLRHRQSTTSTGTAPPARHHEHLRHRQAPSHRQAHRGITAPPRDRPAPPRSARKRRQAAGAGAGAGDAVLLRTTRLVASSTRVAAGASSARPRSSTSFAAASAISVSGCRTVVSGGPTQRAIGRSSNPPTLTSSGMRSPSSRAASYSPSACRSLPAKTA